jgi:hypothetical protein
MPFIPMVERGSGGPARSSPQPPKAVARRARLEGAGPPDHHRPRNGGAAAVAGRSRLRRAHGSLRGRRYPPQHGFREGPTSRCPERGHRAGAPQRRGRDRRAPSRQGRASADGPEGSGAQRAGLASQRNSVLSRHMRCRTTASLRATATLALRAPIRWARACPQVFSQEGLVIRLSTTLAASNR